MLDSRPRTIPLPPTMPRPHVHAPASDLRVACIESAPFAENTYVVFRPGAPACVVIDPGFEPDRVVEAIRADGLAPEAILLTHGHSDHIAGNAALRREWPRIPILIGAGDASKLADPAGNLSGAFGIALTSPPADRLLADRERLDLAGFEFDVHEIPGHSSGHVVYVLTVGTPPVVFAGDVLFHESIGRTDFPDGDFAALARGIRDRLYTLPDDTVVFAGHGPPTTIGHEKRHNPFVPAAVPPRAH
jgi:glyoxylase-like metal-dependent hydrolase (beta-lactamase superfamily II)